MKKIISSILLLQLVFYHSNAQNKRFEDALMDCVYESFEDGGEEFKELVFAYESSLINEKILADRSGKSYYKIIEKIAIENKFEKLPSKFFLLELQKITTFNPKKKEECENTKYYSISNKDALKLRAFESFSTSDEPYLSSFAKHILSLLNEEDFEHEYYKSRFFLLFCTIDTDYGLNINTIESSISEFNNTLKVLINNKSEVYVDGIKVSQKELKRMVNEFVFENKSKYTIEILADKDCRYGSFVDIQNSIVAEINVLREKLANKKYSIGIENLSEEQILEIEKVYPLNLVIKINN